MSYVSSEALRALWLPDARAKSWLADRQRQVLLEAKLLGVDGKWEMLDGVQHLVASRLLDMTSMLGELDVRSRDFH